MNFVSFQHQIVTTVGPVYPTLGPVYPTFVPCVRNIWEPAYPTFGGLCTQYLRDPCTQHLGACVSNIFGPIVYPKFWPLAMVFQLLQLLLHPTLMRKQSLLAELTIQPIVNALWYSLIAYSFLHMPCRNHATVRACCTALKLYLFLLPIHFFWISVSRPES